MSVFKSAAKRKLMCSKIPSKLTLHNPVKFTTLKTKNKTSFLNKSKVMKYKIKNNVKKAKSKFKLESR